MPRLNKCKHRKKMNGFVRNYKRKGKYITHASTQPWNRCGLVKWEDDTTLSQLKCKGWSCGNYEEEEIKDEHTL